MEPHHNRHARLEKQEEFEVEEEKQLILFEADDDSSPSGKASNPDFSSDTMDRLTENKPERRKTSSRVKLLVRSHAVHDDASPPPDLETVITNTNMLSVTTASFATLTQSKGATNKIR
ncbi:uncharacterized protein CEXT_352611 [Caerostris extrusa]|uniref:Uncharacterized protein n=1 Tax=Caerostris extrusa TaxID=172846 RepID=A0AAV4TW89_CAEEX|nr:uncharacterized protein CEXT_352611 [Caerostris extrusa]